MKKRLGICGCTGHVVKFGEMVNSFAESEIAVVWDYREERGRKVAETLNVPFEPDYEKVLDEYGLDGVLVITENSHKAELCIRAAEHGLSIFVEKPMCVSLKEAYAVRDAVNRNGVKFFMTDPFVRRGLIRIKEMMKNGELGTVTEAIFRICQNRPRFKEQFSQDTSQGGIMADVGGHAIHMAHYLFGKPEKLSSVLAYNNEYARSNNVETNARVTMVYPDDLLVSLECSFVSRGYEGMCIVRGTEGSAVVVSGGIGHEREEIVELYRSQNEKEVITDLPDNPKSHIRYFVEMLVNDLPNDIVGVDPYSNSGVSLDHAVEYVEIIDAIYRAGNRGLVEL